MPTSDVPIKRRAGRGPSLPGAALLVAGLAAAVLAGPAAASPSPAVDYVYVEANEGGSSGGHVALRVGDRVFHFNHVAPGLLRASRESFRQFHEQYALRENRALRLSRVPVSDETFRLLFEHFNRHHAVQSQHFEGFDSLRADRRLLAALASAREAGRADVPVAIEGAGYFFGASGEGAGDGAAAEPALARLRARVGDRHGPGFVAARLVEARGQVAGVGPGAADGTPAGRPDRGALAPVYGFAQRHRDAVAGWLAMEVLQAARPLRGEVAVADSEMALGDGERDAVVRLHAALEESLARLAASRRPDWGFPLLVGMARLAALERTLRAGRWVFLDGFPAESAAVSGERLRQRGGIAAALVADAGAELARARARLVAAAPGASGFPEADFAAFEAAANRWREAVGVVREGRDLRLLRDAGPTRPAVRAVPVWPAASQAEIGRARAASERAEAAYLAALRRQHGYHLVRRNCVTEIFRQIDAAFAAAADTGEGGARTAAARAREESIRRLGGHVDAGEGLHFIPAAADLAVAERYAVAARVELPSLRHRRLGLMYQAEPGPLVFLRESNTVTSTAYRRHPEDSVFLFFTEGTVVSRPILGALNLVTGIGAAAVGFAALPVDGGGLLWAGLRGIVFSLPELAFFNIRKGSFDAVESHRAAERAPAGPPGRTAAEGLEGEGDRTAEAGGAR